ncbi:22841_t:CDS:1, partial [Racocetra persica]
ICIEIKSINKESNIKVTLYDLFEDIKNVAEGGFGKIFKAHWVLNSEEAKTLFLVELTFFNLIETSTT